jgi:hypothetical protein
MRPERTPRPRIAADRESLVAELGVPAPTTAQLAAYAHRPRQLAAAAYRATGEAVISPTAPSAILPASFDLRAVDGQNYVPEVRDLPSRAASVAAAIVAAMETTAAYTRQVPGLALDLSETHLHHAGGPGGSPSDLFAEAATGGVAFEDAFPHRDSGIGKPAPGWHNRIAKAVGVTDLTADPAAIKQHIYGFGAVAACALVHDDFLDYPGGVYRPRGGSPLGGHGLALIGWDDEAGCWIARNSYGPNWGDGGVVRLAYGEAYVEDYPGIRRSVLGCTSVDVHARLPAQHALRLFVTANDATGWTYLENLGWAHLAGDQHTMTRTFAELANARTHGNPVVPFINGTELRAVEVAN